MTDKRQLDPALNAAEPPPVHVNGRLNRAVATRLVSASIAPFPAKRNKRNPLGMGLLRYGPSGLENQGPDMGCVTRRNRTAFADKLLLDKAFFAGP